MMEGVTTITKGVTIIMKGVTTRRTLSRYLGRGREVLIEFQCTTYLFELFT